MTMFGKDDDPFKAGKEEQGPSFTGGEGHACERPERLWACEGAAGILGLCPRMQNPRLRRGIMIHGMEMCARTDVVEKIPRKQMELQRMQLHRSLSKTPGESSKGLQFSQTTIESSAMQTPFFRANMAAGGKARYPSMARPKTGLCVLGCSQDGHGVL